MFGYQTVLCDEYRDVYHLDPSLTFCLEARVEDSFWKLMEQRDLEWPRSLKMWCLTEVDPWHQKTLADFLVTADRLKIQIADMRNLYCGKKLHCRRTDGVVVPIHRIYNRAIVDELIAKKI